MRGYLSDLNPLAAAVLYALQQAREDLAERTQFLTREQIWRAAGDIAPVGFHIRHIAGSVDRLTTYAEGSALSDEQMTLLQREKDRDLSREELLDLLDRAFQHAEAVIRAVDPASFAEQRFIGRKRIPTTLGGLLVHIADHTQRHVGAAIVTARFVQL